MSRVDYRVDRLSLIGNPAFAEASKEELRALLALIELSGMCESVSALAEAASISPARCKAALAFWEEAGVIAQGDCPIVREEFESRLVRGEIDEVPAREVADSIRDEGLASMIDECATLLGLACLPNSDVKNVTALHTQYSLSAEYIVELAAHLAERGSLTARRLCDEAIRLCGKGIDKVEDLEAYINDMNSSTAAEWEYRRVLGIYGRNLSQSEKNYFRKWDEEFGYSVGIVSEAYDIAVMNTKTGRGDLRYMDSILTSWHEAGCRTVAECRERVEAERLRREGERSEQKKRVKTAPETPRYGNFDINEAFNNAVARSFGSEEEGED